MRGDDIIVDLDSTRSTSGSGGASIESSSSSELLKCGLPGKLCSDFLLGTDICTKFAKKFGKSVLSKSGLCGGSLHQLQQLRIRICLTRDTF